MLTAAMMLATIAAAQIKTLPGEPITVTATITAIEAKTRTLTLRSPNGNVTTTTVSPEVKRFDALKVGDVITAKYNETLILRLMKPGEAKVDSATGSVAANPGARPSATATAQRSITATVTAIDHSVPSITLVGPERTYTTKVTDKEALKQLKVGDRLDVTLAAAVVVSVEDAKPK